MRDYNAELRTKINDIAERTRRGMFPFVVRFPALDAATKEYAYAQAERYDGKRAALIEAGRSPNTLPIPYRDEQALSQCADIILHEELAWSHPDKMSIVEFPIMSERLDADKRRKNIPVADLVYGNRSGAGKRISSWTTPDDTPMMTASALVDPNDPVIAEAIQNVDLYAAIERADLSERQRACIDLVYGEGRTQADAADHLGVSQQAVDQTIKRALIKLREQLGVTI